MPFQFDLTAASIPIPIATPNLRITMVRHVLQVKLKPRIPGVVEDCYQMIP